MAARSVSPGAALLRSSRMFSIPNPIPSSPTDYSTATKHHSATATKPYPTHLTITTPPSSRMNGDWGFKRPLPLKTTTKQTVPYVRVRQLDSTEHVTDFQSASDHAMTLKKFQELNLPIFVPTAQTNDRDVLARHPRSVFEEDGDITAVEPDQMQATENKRWKFKGPWLAGMADGEFNKWLERSVRTRRSEFRAYLKEIYAKELTEERRAQAVREAMPVPPEVVAEDITESQFLDYLRDLRQDRLVLYRYVSRFLDLAPLSTENQYLHTMKLNRSQQFDRPNPYGTLGPPITHPSAGLSYLRTPNFMDNHPIYGPQKFHPVVKARVLKPQNVETGVHEPAIGIAGFITDRPTDQKILGRTTHHTPRGNPLSFLELEGGGGAKLYYQVDSATVDSGGRVRINLSDPGNNMTELVTKEMLGEDGAKNEVYMNALQDSSIPNLAGDLITQPTRKRGVHMYGSNESYGLGGPGA
ncbi:putative 37S ribosomal protein [Rosellinia necatrix]|uniref:Putative 37S ribosomal protein n=1 Tax=Rosellinia necatrix TaxID=77044 RepID=A0A1W2TB21_ROSNE|nr:putative 37S ribosomal protein [Rosellinia necatrix]